jgi:hypothetical protein
MSTLEIPPGCRIIFFEDILHEIVKITVKGYDRYRQFLGFQIFKNLETGLVAERTEIVERQLLPKITGGTDMYAALHLCFHKPLLVRYSKLCINPEYVETKTDKYGVEYEIVRRQIECSLIENGTNIYTYTAHDKEIMIPHSIL